MATFAPWTDLEAYRQLLADYEKRTEEYSKALAAYREAEAAGNADLGTKGDLDRQYAEIARLYDRIKELRRNLAEARDASLAKSSHYI